MTRALYRCLLWLHPAEYAEHFSAEMLWIFDLRRANDFGIALLLDCFESLFRQWLAVPPVRTLAIGFSVSYTLALACAIAAWCTTPRP
jgi:hypothetical protein